MKILSYDKVKFFFPYLSLIVAGFLAMDSIYFPLQEDEGLSICKMSLDGIKHFYTFGDEIKFPYGSIFYENQPFYFMLLKIYALIFAPSKISLRLLSLIFYIFSFKYFYSVAIREYKNDVVALLVSLSLAVSPFLVFHSSAITEIMLFYVLSLMQLSYFKELQSREYKSFNKYLAISFLVTFVHYMAIIPLIVQLIMLNKIFLDIGKKQKIMLKVTLSLVFLNLLIHLPFLIYIRFQAKIPIVPFSILFEEFLEQMIYMLGGTIGIVDGFDVRYIFPCFLGLMLMLSYYFHFKKFRNPFRSDVSYHYVIIPIGLLILGFFKFILKVHNVEFYLIIFLLPSIYLVVGNAFMKISQRNKIITWFLLSFMVFFNLKNLNTFLGEFKNKYSVIESALKFISKKSDNNTVYTDNYWMAPCTVKSLYDTLFYPDTLTIKGLMEFDNYKLPHPQVLLIYELDNLKIKNSNILDSFSAPELLFKLYYQKQ